MNKLINSIIKNAISFSTPEIFDIALIHNLRYPDPLNQKIYYFKLLAFSISKRVQINLFHCHITNLGYDSNVYNKQNYSNTFF